MKYGKEKEDDRCADRGRGHDRRGAVGSRVHGVFRIRRRHARLRRRHDRRQDRDDVYRRQGIGDRSRGVHTAASGLHVRYVERRLAGKPQGHI